MRRSNRARRDSLVILTHGLRDDAHRFCPIFYVFLLTLLGPVARLTDIDILSAAQSFRTNTKVPSTTLPYGRTASGW